MRLIRRFEERVVDLVNANEIAGVTHEYVGQEAVATGVCAALGPTDVITSTHRGHGHVIAKGADVPRMMRSCSAASTGSTGGEEARCTSPTWAGDLRRQRDRRGRCAVRRGSGLGGPAGRDGRRRHHVLRRRRSQPGRPARDDEPVRSLAAARALRVREQRVRGHALAGAVDSGVARRARGRLRHRDRGRRRHGRRRGARRRDHRGGTRQLRQWADVPRVSQLPVLRPQHRRADDEARLPHRRGDRRVAPQGPADPRRRRPRRCRQRPHRRGGRRRARRGRGIRTRRARCRIPPMPSVSSTRSGR